MKTFESATLGLRNTSLSNQNIFTHVNHQNPQPGLDNPHTPLIKKVEPKYDTWQTALSLKVYKFLRGTGPKLELIVNVSPAGGKSSPISKAWQTVVEESYFLKNIPKILWVCANKTLTFEKFNDFKKDILDMLIKSSNIEYNHSAPVDTRRAELPEIKMASKPEFPPSTTEKLITNRYPNSEIPSNISPQLANFLMKRVQALVGFEMQNNKIEVHPATTIAYSCTYSYAPKILDTFKADIIIIDELQERFPSSAEENDDKISSLLLTIQKASPNASIIMLTGSMNNTSCINLANILNLKTGRHFETEIHPALNRASISIVPMITSKNDEIVKLTVEQIRSKSSKNLITIFSTDKIKNISNNIISKTPEFPPEIIIGYKPYSDLDRDRPKDFVKVTKIISNTKNEYISPEWMYGHLTNMMKSTNENTLFLSKCIQHKFGFIFAPKNPDGTKSDFDVNDVIIVQELFKQSKIHTVFATTMVGVGVNLSVRNLYIPSIQIYKGKNISQSDITQLINRAGRTPDAFADIYCNPNDVGFILKALDDLPGNHIPIIGLNDMKSRIDNAEKSIINGQIVDMTKEKSKETVNKNSVDLLKSIFGIYNY